MRRNLFLLLIVCSLSCKKTEIISHQVTWEVVQVLGKSEIFKKGRAVIFDDDTLFVWDNNRKRSFKMVLTDNRLIVENNSEKLLFCIEHISDTAIVLNELFESDPDTINLMYRINNINFQK